MSFPSGHLPFWHNKLFSGISQLFDAVAHGTKRDAVVPHRDSLRCSHDAHRLPLLTGLELWLPVASSPIQHNGGKAEVAATSISDLAGPVALITRGHFDTRLVKPWRGFCHGIRSGVNSTQQKQPEIKATSQTHLQTHELEVKNSVTVS